ncbi:GNAT family N-acetyltransferase, partial [Klebsiella pneumoniae]
MPPLLIAATTPDAPGFAALRIESLEQHFNMLRRLAENWQSGKNRFNAPGETLLGAFVNHQLVGVCGINSDPFSPQPRAGRIRHLYISERYRRRGIGQQLL